MSGEIHLIVSRVAPLISPNVRGQFLFPTNLILIQVFHACCSFCIGHFFLASSHSWWLLSLQVSKKGQLLRKVLPDHPHQLPPIILHQSILFSLPALVSVLHSNRKDYSTYLFCSA